MAREGSQSKIHASGWRVRLEPKEACPKLADYIDVGLDNALFEVIKFNSVAVCRSSPLGKVTSCVTIATFGGIAGFLRTASVINKTE